MAIIVTLTTTSERLNMCRAALSSLVIQDSLPDKIIVNLSNNKYLKDKGVNREIAYSNLIDGMPSNTHTLVELNWVENTGPYRKLIPTLISASAEDIIITADDDIFYGKFWLKSLLKDFNPDDRTIHAARVRKQNKNFLNKLTGYIFWPIIEDNIVIHDGWIITFGGGAVLYKGWFSNEILLDNKYLEIAPTADDLWYSKICKINNLSVKVISQSLKELNFIKHNHGLEYKNLNLQTSNRLISKLKYRFIDHPLNYLNIKKFGNDIFYEAIESHFKDDYR